VIEILPASLATRGPDALLAFELVVANPGGAPLDAIRANVGATTASPDVADQIAAFAAAAPDGGITQFDLAGGASHRIGGELLLPGDRMYVTEHGDRALIVPVVLVSLRWRAGLSVRTATASFVIGVGDRTAAKLGPVWVDRAGQVYTRLSARPFAAPGAPRR
jgi:hypothetical protein